MEFMNRGARQTPPVTSPVTSSAHVPNNGTHKKGPSSIFGLKFASVALLFSATILVVALLWFLVFSSPANEAKHVDSKKLQAVFLNGGQVYFGHINDLNGSFMRVSDIYYLRVNQQVQPDQENAQASANDISLVKLGCELHGPDDEMLINRDQVVFWENLKDDGQVAKAVKQYKDQNPNGQDCAQAQQQTTTDTTPAEEETPATTNSSSNSHR